MNEGKKRGRGRERGKRWDANEKAGPESGVEKVNNGRTGGDRDGRLAGEEYGRTLLIYIKIKKLLLIR